MFINQRTHRRVLGVVAPIACVALLTQCDNFLETEPFGALNTGTYYKSAQDFESATVGAYATLQNLTYSGRDQSLFEQGLLPDDDTRAPGADEDSDFSWTPTNNSIGYIWDVSYRGVLRSNLILQQLENATTLTDAQKARFAGEAKFTRAYFNFILARYFGTPPVVTAPASSVEETRKGNSKPGEIWDLIESDLEDAIKGLAGQRMETGRATEWAARALLGKVEIYRAQWGQANQAILGGVAPQAKYREAIEHLQPIVNSGRFQLVPYQNNFKHTTENNAESLFELQASFGTDINGWAAVDENGGGASSGTGRPLATGANGGPTGVRAPGGGDWGDGGIIVTNTLVDAFEAYDTMEVAVPTNQANWVAAAGASPTATVVTRDPRAYFTFYSAGQEYGRACGAVPGPYNFRWTCRAPSLAVGPFGLWSVTGHTAAKYIRPYENFAGGYALNQSVSQNNERLIRYADVLLLLAEAKLLGNNDVAGAAALINQVRARARNAWDAAYGPQSADAELYAGFTRPANLLPDRPAGASVAQMMRWLMHERRVELALEFGRYDDLIRWLNAGLIQRADVDFGDDTANQRFNLSVHRLRPIPLGELDLNPNLTQNPGY